MRDVVAENFGLAIAYLCPGLLALVALSFFNDALAAGLSSAAAADSSVGGFVFILMASVGLGVFVSNARYFVFDKGLFKLSFIGIPEPAPDTGVLRRTGEHAAAWDVLRDQFYRYYQFSSNTSVALAVAFVAWWSKDGFPGLVIAVAFLLAEGILVAGAIDTIRKYRTRTSLLTATEPLRAVEETNSQ